MSWAAASVVSTKRTLSPGRICVNRPRSTETTAASRGYPPTDWRLGSSTIGWPDAGTCTTPALTEEEIISRGFIYLKDADELLEQIKSTVIEVLNSTRQIRNGRRRDRLQEALSRMLYNETKRRPMVFSLINER